MSTAHLAQMISITWNTMIAAQYPHVRTFSFRKKPRMPRERRRFIAAISLASASHIEIAGVSLWAFTSCGGGVLLLPRRLRDLAGVRARAGVLEREAERPLRLRLRATEPLRFEGILLFFFFVCLSIQWCHYLSVCVRARVCVCVCPGSGKRSGNTVVALIASFSSGRRLSFSS
ncbi:hypothetical protein, conserved [Leishmania tarentolae]|uniref:Uncharacterized protein n=1 Tax=Leishmania tarentolae TaxID=5689 RepID=A0A640KLC5_LEITA|nr:hypothetical protein, conserved [Leishmania tarentolae]